MAKARARVLLIMLLGLMSLTPRAWTARAAEPLGGTPDEPPLLMAALGDSITAATFADLPIPPGLTPEDRVLAWAEQGLSPQFIFENKEKLSWASGNRIRSHFVRLRQYLRQEGDRRRLVVLNVAIPGAQSPRLIMQAKAIAQAMASGKYATLKYVTLLIGANDACDKDEPGGLPNSITRASVLEALNILSSIPQDEPIRVLMLGIPKIAELGRPAIRYSRTIFGLTCETVRNDLLKFCNNLLLWNTRAEHEAATAVVTGVNRTLREVATEAVRFLPHLELSFSTRLTDYRVTHDDLALDCFHPNARTQQEIARRTWEDQPWFKLRSGQSDTSSLP